MEDKKLLTEHRMEKNLAALYQKIRSEVHEDLEPSGLHSNLLLAISVATEQAEFIDQNCQFNIDAIGDKLRSDVQNFLRNSAEVSPLDLQHIFSCLYRLLSEADFYSGGNILNSTYINSFIDSKIDEFPKDVRRQLIFASYLMPARITRELIANPSIADFREFPESVKHSREMKEQWDAEFLEHTKLLKGLSEQIKNLTTEYNFVGLAHGFRALQSQKKAELRFSFGSLIILGGLLIAAPAAQLSMIGINLSTIEAHRSTLIYTIPSLIAIEIFLLYFFRVVLIQFRSVKAQLLQIDLRTSLCQFIEGYAEYASRMKKDDSVILSRFEALIFSGLVADSSDIPSTFDGAEQIANIIKSLRN